MTDTFDVAIVGFGPSGATCTGLLGKLGVRTLAIDRSRDVYDKPRAFALDHEIMRVFQELGIAEEVKQYTAPFTPSEYYGVDGQLIKRLGSVPPPYPLGWPPNMVFTQPPVEAALRERAARLPSVELALGTELASLEQSAEAVTLQLRSDTGATRQVRAQYVIGCDGASSTVRVLSGIEYDDLQFDEPWVVVDVLVNERGLRKLPDVSVQYCEPARPSTYLIGPGNHRRWEIMLLPGDDLQEVVSETHVWRLLSRWITPKDATLWRTASYRFHALVAREWRRGRVFIAGDAAHQQPPFTGQGMCQGVRDVANLSWKLHLALQDKAGEHLLDTYEAERSTHVRRYTTLIKGIGQLICERDPEAARARDRRLLAEAGGTVETTPRQHLLPPLETGVISPVAHRANGTIFPQPRVRHGQGKALLDSVTGTGIRIIVDDRFPLSELRRQDSIERLGATVVRFAAPHPRLQALRNSWGDGKLLNVTESDALVARWFEQHECSAAIVRPDNYVYGVAVSTDALDEQLERLSASISV